MKYKYDVSVIVPVYNVSNYIEISLLSICKQNFDNYEIIIVNDGTKDDSAEIAKNILEKECHCDYRIINQENKGLPGARNTGLKNAEGKYVVFVDSDDVITEDFLSSLYNCCEKDDLSAAFAEYEITRMDNRDGRDFSNNGIEILTRDQLLYVNMLRSVKIHLCAVMMKRQFLLDNNLWFNESLRYGEEVDYTWRMYPLLDRIAHVKSKMYKYLVRENSLMTNQNIDRVVFLLKTMNINITKWFNANPEDADKFRWAESKIYFEKMHAFAQQSEYETFRSLLNQTNYIQKMQMLTDFPDIKIRILALIMRKAPKIFWRIFQIHKL